MATTLFIDPLTNDLAVDANGNIAVATGAWQLAQDVSTALKTYMGECWYDTTLGLPYYSKIIGRSPSATLMKAQFTAVALSVDGVVAAKVFFTSLAGRAPVGQVQVTDAAGATAFAQF